MAYADQQMSGNRLTALIIVALIHVVGGYLLVTGLAYEGMRQVLKRVTTVDIKQEEKKKEPPPPPPKNLPPPPPIVAPPPPVNVAVAPPVIQTVQAPPPPPPPIIQAPARPTFVPKAPQAKSNPASWATEEDYPSRAYREGKTGVTGFRLTVGPDGRVTNCEVTSSSGSADLDQATCTLVSRRAKFSPSTDENGQPTTGTYSNRIRWQITSSE